MPRSLQPDRKLFGVTLALCLIGAVMVFSASAVTARDEYGNGYYFLLRQLVWLAFGIAGMFWLMNMDYRKLRQPRVIFTALGVTFLLLIAVFFLDRSHAHASLDPAGAAEPAAVGIREARGDFLSGVVPRIKARAARRGREQPDAHATAGAGHGAADGGDGLQGAGPGHGVHDFLHRGGDAVHRRDFDPIHRGGAAVAVAGDCDLRS